MNEPPSFTRTSIGLLCLFYLGLAVFTLFTYEGTGDSGDSILHFLMAGWAPEHTWAYFHH